MSKASLNLNKNINYEQYKKIVLEDYKTVVLSRECSVIGRREVFLGKGKFGIFGDGKELPQMALNHFFNDGDFRSGYYRDQTLLMAQKLLTPENFFAALYAHTDLNFEPMSGGRQMGGHFLSKSINKDGSWVNLMKQKNHSSDISPTASQMPRLVGLAQASKFYRKLKIKNSKNFSNNGNEIAWGTIGNASTSEGMFFESVNAAGVLQIPMVISIWDDDYGISVSNELQTTKSSISEALSGFEKTSKKEGFEIIKVKGWDYPSLIKAYSKAEKRARIDHIPVIVHVTELTQPLGHSSSGSHERYKSDKRLEWERKNDCNIKFRNWIIQSKLSDKETLNKIDSDAKIYAKNAKTSAWKNYQEPILEDLKKFNTILDMMERDIPCSEAIKHAKSQIINLNNVGYREILSIGRGILPSITNNINDSKINLVKYLKVLSKNLQPKFSSNLYSNDVLFDLIPPKYSKEKNLVDRIYLTRVHHKFEGDTFFPKLSNDWIETDKREFFKDKEHKFDFTFYIYEKKK